jgi:predicted helicase
LGEAGVANFAINTSDLSAGVYDATVRSGDEEASIATSINVLAPEAYDRAYEPHATELRPERRLTLSFVEQYVNGLIDEYISPIERLNGPKRAENDPDGASRVARWQMPESIPADAWAGIIAATEKLIYEASNLMAGGARDFSLAARLDGSNIFTTATIAIKKDLLASLDSRALTDGGVALEIHAGNAKLSVTIPTTTFVETYESREIVDVYGILETFREEATSNRDLGDKFERLVAGYLLTDPIYAEQFDAIWLWHEWPLRWGQDTGIDLVARERLTGNYCAVQCKFYDPSHTLQKGDIDAFFTTSGKTFAAPPADIKGFSSRMIVSTTDRWSKNAEEALAGQVIPVTRLRVQDMASSPVDWSKFSLANPERLTLRSRKQSMPHQVTAIDDVLAGFEKHDRGKLIMACGTGKTFVSLKLAEAIASGGGKVLFLVPSISLLSQALREWTAEAEESFYAFAVCSDTKVGRHHEDMSAHDLAVPATTDPDRLVDAIKRLGDRKLTVVFSTYQSISVIAEAQRRGLCDFDVIICDEAHRTTGVTLQDEDESYFVKVHNQAFVKASKRLYMTATPRIFADSVKSKAGESDATLCSMDDEALYGPVLHRLGFGEAVARGLLTDYKVLVLAVDEQHVSSALQYSLADASKELKLDDAVKIVGCWNGLAKRFIGENSSVEDGGPMHRAVAFARSIKDSKRFADMFYSVVTEYTEKRAGELDDLICETDHVDGTFNVLVRNQKLDWLKAPIPENICRVLSNARCLSEGVDVPALDAVLFLNPRDSVVDVVQSVGRVMRKSKNKKYGYVILPISVPAGIPAEEALKDNQRYKVVWQVLQALRAHDDRFHATINQIELNRQRPDQIQVIGIGGEETNVGQQFALQLPDIEAWKAAIYAKIVIKCGDRRYWEDWAKDVALIAERHGSRIKALLADRSDAAKAFAGFLSGLRENINPNIGEAEAIEMLSQHLVTRPVFDALFEDYSFTQQNPVSLTMQEVLSVLDAESMEKEVEGLRGFYESVRQRVKGIDNAEGRQKVVVELYDKFFKRAFPRMSERLGIVYTPVEVVDFIIRSAEEALKSHLGVNLSDEGVHVLDPFVGTGTFLVRLLQSGLIRPVDISRKYEKELHANEIVLLAYYIAAINIEETYHGIVGGVYRPFDGIVLADTFQAGESAKETDFVNVIFPDNNKRAIQQRSLDIRVIFGNPPYSAGQGSANDNNPNVDYPALDRRIESTYAALSKANLKKSNYDSYTRAIRWASDKIKDQGVIGFVTNGSFIDASNMDGVRKTLLSEFAAVYCFNLRGNAHTQGEQRRKERGNVFGEGTRSRVAITILIKTAVRKGPGELFYYDIGDYLTREDKLGIISDLSSIKNVKWQKIVPNSAGDWIDQRHPEFEKFIPLGDKATGGVRALFTTYSLGISTNRDAWVYNFDKMLLAKNVSRLIEVYNEEVSRYERASKGKPPKERPLVKDFVNSDAKKISWSDGLKADLERGRKFKLNGDHLVVGLYRPFCKQNLYFDRSLNERVLQIPKLFPTPSHENVVISTPGVGASNAFSAIVTNVIPNLHLNDTGQCFPLYWYEKEDETHASASQKLVGGPDDRALFNGYVRHDSITDWTLGHFKEHYEDDGIKKEDIFYYVYGLFHSPQFREKYQASLRKMLPRVPQVSDFWKFAQAGRGLANWHLNYESVEPFELYEESKELCLDPREHYRVHKMVFAKNSSGVDKSTVIVNSKVRLIGIPAATYQYVVNGKPALEWVMERYAVTIDKDSGIKNDPNAWSSDPRYIVDLVKRITRVSIETVEIIKMLPHLEN